MKFISEELQKDVDTGVMDKSRIYSFIVDRMPHTGDYELSIIWNDDIAGEYLYNTTSEALADMDNFIEAGFIVEDL